MFKKIKIPIALCAMVIFAVLSASAQSTLSIKVQPFAPSIYRLDVKGTSSQAVNVFEALISYDNTVVIPVSYTMLGDLSVSSQSQGTEEPFTTDLSLAPVQWLVKEDRTAFKIAVYSLEQKPAYEELTLFSFFFRVIDGEKIARDTFRVERDFGEGSFLASIYNGNDAQNGAAIFFGTDTYGATNGAPDSIDFDNVDISNVSPQDKIMVGDVNQDGTINIADAILLSQRIASQDIIFTKNQLKSADCVLNGRTDIADAIKLKQYLANNDIEFE